MSLNSEWPEGASPAPPLPVSADAIPPSLSEDPPWSFWDVCRIVLAMFVCMLVSLLLVTFIVKRAAFPSVPFMQVMSFPLVAFSGQIVAYLGTFGFMFVTATRTSGRGFWAAVRWNWPRAWPAYLLVGMLFCIGLQFLTRFLPMPKEVPMETFFETPLRAWVLSLFGMTFIPLMEELFFRGFLYPVLARRLGLVFAVLLTTIAFASIHVPQLADPHMPLSESWGGVLVIFIIGFALSIIRAVKKSVAAGVLVHMGYNGFTSLLAMLATGGFRHLERITH